MLHVNKPLGLTLASRHTHTHTHILSRTHHPLDPLLGWCCPWATLLAEACMHTQTHTNKHWKLANFQPLWCISAKVHFLLIVAREQIDFDVQACTLFQIRGYTGYKNGGCRVENALLSPPRGAAYHWYPSLWLIPRGRLLDEEEETSVICCIIVREQRLHNEKWMRERSLFLVTKWDRLLSWFSVMCGSGCWCQMKTDGRGFLSGFGPGSRELPLVRTLSSTCRCPIARYQQTLD